MSGTGESAADFAGEERNFRIRLGEIRRVELKSPDGIGAICGRLARGLINVRRLGDEATLAQVLASGIEIRADDVREPIYQGLVGFGMTPGEATRLVRSEIDDRGLRGLIDNIGTALIVLIGAQEAPPDEGDAGEKMAKPSPAKVPKSSTSPTSTATPAPSA